MTTTATAKTKTLAQTNELAYGWEGAAVSLTMRASRRACDYCTGLPTLDAVNDGGKENVGSSLPLRRAIAYPLVTNSPER